ncbi:DNA-processing protein DprA [Curvibacter gracilis]|uniref:DNA-processing protein DprA n=1 Tax=Curvibacter gracilis TaxID=230310 RepID=UPI0004861548|nr:DNA-processing protein DprA [Curvibacter gracilis]
MQREELQAWLRLTLSPGVGNQSARRLLAALGSPEAVFEAAPERLHELVTPAQAQALSQPPTGLEALLERTWSWLQAPADGLCHQLLTLGDPAYPADLLQLADPPLMLYALSGRPLPHSEGPLQAVAVVGSRNPSAQGLENAHAFAHSLVGQGFCVVSGLALGIDGAAHEGALSAATGSADTALWPTLAVVGTGLDRVYPRQHRDLAHRVALQGVMLSEYPLGTPPLAANFPKRNRLIAALSRGTLVVEAALASGSLVTARLAAEQGKEVYAIPGSIHSPQSKGCHALIRQGAKLVETVHDILEELPAASSHPVQLGLPMAPRSEETDCDAEAANGDEVLAALGQEPCTLDTLQARCGWPTPALQARLLTLELNGQLSRLPGGRFQRIGMA